MPSGTEQDRPPWATSQLKNLLNFMGQNPSSQPGGRQLFWLCESNHLFHRGASLLCLLAPHGDSQVQRNYPYPAKDLRFGDCEAAFCASYQHSSVYTFFTFFLLRGTHLNTGSIWKNAIMESSKMI